MSSIPFFDAKDFPEDPDKLIAQFSPMVIDKAIALLPNRTRALECQQRVASLRSDEAVTYNELTAVKPEHMRQFERMVQKAILQPCPWLYLRFHSVSDPKVQELVEARIRKLQDREQDNVRNLYGELSTVRAITLTSTENENALKTFLVAQCACFWNGGQISWHELVEVWARHNDTPPEGIALKNGLYQRLSGKQAEQKMLSAKDSFQIFVSRYTLMKIFKENVKLQCEEKIHAQLLNSFKINEKERKFALYYTTQVAQGTPCSKEIFECSPLLKQFFGAIDIVGILAAKSPECDRNALFTLLFRSTEEGRALFREHRDALDLAKLLEAIQAKVIPCSKEDEFTLAVRTALFAAPQDVKRLIGSVETESPLKTLYYIMQLAKELLPGPIDIEAFITLFQEMTQLAKKQFTQFDLQKRLLLCMNMLAHSVERQERRIVKVEHEAAFIDAGLCYASRPDFADAISQTMQKLLGRELSQQEEVYLLARAYYSSLEEVPEELPTKLLEQLKKYAVDGRQLLILLFWAIERSSVIDDSAMTVNEACAFIKQVESLVGADLPAEIVFSALVTNKLPRKLIPHPDRLKAIQKLLVRQKGIHTAELQEELEEIWLDIAVVDDLSTDRFYYLPLEQGFCKVLSNFARLSVTTLKVRYESTNFGLQPFFPHSLKLERAVQFAWLLPRYPVHSKGTLYTLEADEKGLHVHLHVLHSLNTLKSRSVRANLPITEKELTDDSELIFIVETIICLFSQEKTMLIDDCKRAINAQIELMRGDDEFQFEARWQRYKERVGEEKAWQEASKAYFFVRDIIQGLEIAIPSLVVEPQVANWQEELKSGNVYEVAGGLSLLPKYHLDSLPLDKQSAYTLIYSHYLPILLAACNSFQEEEEHTESINMWLDEEVSITISLTRQDGAFLQTVAAQDKNLSFSISIKDTIAPEVQAKLLMWQMMMLKSNYFSAARSTR